MVLSEILETEQAFQNARKSDQQAFSKDRAGREAWSCSKGYRLGKPWGWGGGGETDELDDVEPLAEVKLSHEGGFSIVNTGCACGLVGQETLSRDITTTGRKVRWLKE